MGQASLPCSYDLSTFCTKSSLVLDSSHSDGCFIKAYPAETTEAFLDGHVSTFSFLDGVPQGILYDNTKLAMARILGDDGGSAPGRSSSSSPTTRSGCPGKNNYKGKVGGPGGLCSPQFPCAHSVLR